MRNNIYPRPHDKQTVYLKDVIIDPDIEVGDYTIYNDFVHDPCDFEKNNVLYHYPINGDKLKIGRFCSIACGAKFMFTSGNHLMKSLATYTFQTALAILAVFTAFMVIGRLISSVHWLTDIIGGILLSAGLVALYVAVCGSTAAGK